jgi:hypothetical protein
MRSVDRAIKDCNADARVARRFRPKRIDLKAGRRMGGADPGLHTHKAFALLQPEHSDTQRACFNLAECMQS